MNSREKMLAIAVGAVLALFALKWGYDYVVEMFDTRDAEIADRRSKKEKADATVRDGLAADRRMKKWEERSLPTDKQFGPTNYMHWLTGLANKDLDDPDVTRGNDGSDKGAGARGGGLASKDAKPLYEKYRFHIKAESDPKMTKLVKFLYDFYAANHLQTIRNLSIVPDNSKKLTVSIDIEAMMLPTASRPEELLKDPLPKLALGDLNAYQKVVGGRDLFEPYKEPPQNIVKRDEPPFDIAKYTKLTGITSVNDQREIDVNVQPTKQQFNGLKVGDEFQIGDSANKVTYKVLEIGAYDAVLLVDGKDRKHIKLGDVLRDAVPVSETPTGL